MAWFGVDDHIHSHPKPRKAGLAAMGLWAMAGAWSKAGGTDGWVALWYIDSWGEGSRALADRLVEARLWDRVEDGYQFRAWEEYQQTKEQEDRARALARERKRRYLEKKEREELEGRERSTERVPNA